MSDYISKKQLREFGYLVGIGFPILLGWFLPVLAGHSFRLWTLYIGIPSLLLGIFSPRLLFYPYKVWMKLGEALGWLNSRIILGLVFLIVLQPIALFMRAFGYDPLKKRISDKESYREDKKNHQVDLTRIF